MDCLEEFRLTRTLQSRPDTKETVLLGTIRDEPCIVKLRRLALPELEPGAAIPLSSRTQLDANSVYSWGTASLAEGATCYVDIVYPASPQHVAKYIESPKHVVTESAADYARAVAPWVATQRGAQIDWVRGILYEGVEADRVLFRNDDFVLLPNSKWDRTNVDALYLLALAGPALAEIASLRDLTAAHVPVLEAVRAKTLELVAANFGLAPSRVKIYFHYHPSYYHLHLHVTNVAVQAPDDFGRCVLLEQVLEMLKQKPMREYALTYVVAENHPVFALVAGGGANAGVSPVH